MEMRWAVTLRTKRTAWRVPAPPLSASVTLSISIVVAAPLSSPSNSTTSLSPTAAAHARFLITRWRSVAAPNVSDCALQFVTMMEHPRETLKEETASASPVSLSSLSGHDMYVAPSTPFSVAGKISIAISSSEKKERISSLEFILYVFWFCDDMISLM